MALGVIAQEALRRLGSFSEHRLPPTWPGCRSYCWTHDVRVLYVQSMSLGLQKTCLKNLIHMPVCHQRERGMNNPDWDQLLDYFSQKILMKQQIE